MFRTRRSLHRWVEAGLLDPAQVARIEAWEAGQASPTWLWAVASAGGFAVVLGVAALIAANWDAIPGPLKIGVHLTLNVAVATALYRAWRENRHRLRELLSLLLFALTLTGIGLIGQVYQFGSTTWQALLLWMAACTPYLAITTRSSVAALAWSLAATATFVFAMGALDDLLSAWLGTTVAAEMAWSWLFASALLACGLLHGLRPGHAAQGNVIAGFASLLLIGVASWPSLSLAVGGTLVGALAGRTAATIASALILVPTVLWTERRARAGSINFLALALAGALTWWASVAAWVTLFAHGAEGQHVTAQVVVALIFLLFWAWLGLLALRSGNRGAFAAAFVVIGLRIAMLYWEALGSLLSTGIGLIGGGLLCMALAALGWRLMRRQALART